MQTIPRIHNLRAFLPSKDYDRSRAFYQKLGFPETWHSDDLAVYKLGSFSFYLQKFYVAEWAENFMMLMEVSSADGWWAHLQSLNLAEEFPEVRLGEPKTEDWARECTLVDPAGVCWHFAEFADSPAAASAEVRNYAGQMRELAAGNPWQGVTYAMKLEGLSAEDAFTQPVPGVHSAAEILSHVRAWRRYILERLKGNADYDLRLKSPENWLPLEALKKEGWENIQADAASLRDQIIGLLESETDDFLDRPFLQRDGREFTFRYLVEGVLHHDIYHLGQIALALRVAEEQRKAQATD